MENENTTKTDEFDDADTTTFNRRSFTPLPVFFVEEDQRLHELFDGPVEPYADSSPINLSTKTSLIYHKLEPISLKQKSKYKLYFVPEIIIVSLIAGVIYAVTKFLF